MLHTTPDRLISAPVPDEPGWSTEETCGAVAGPVVTTMLKCKRVVPGEFLFFLAKDYSVPADQVREPEHLIRAVFSKTYEKMFTEVRYDRVTTFESLGVTWAEAAMQMLHPRLGAIAKLERVAMVGQHVLIVSAEGAQRDVARHWSTSVSTWMAGVRFSRLPAAAPG